jgi:hypothetical protein
MITAGVLQASRSKTHPFSVAILTGDKEKTNHSINFFLGNEDDVPHHLKQTANCGEPVAIIVKVELADQFAYYVGEETLKEELMGLCEDNEPMREAIVKHFE